MFTTCVRLYVCVCMCFYVKSLLRDPRPPRRVSVTLFASRFSPLGPCAKDSKRAFAARRTGVASAKRVSQRSRSEKRPGTVMLSTSSRSRHNLPILYVYTLFLSNAILSSFVTFRFVCMCVFLFFFVRLSSPQSRWRVHRAHLPQTIP